MSGCHLSGRSAGLPMRCGCVAACARGAQDAAYFHCSQSRPSSRYLRLRSGSVGADLGRDAAGGDPGGCRAIRLRCRRHARGVWRIIDALGGGGQGLGEVVVELVSLDRSPLGDAVLFVEAPGPADHLGPQDAHSARTVAVLRLVFGASRRGIGARRGADERHADDGAREEAAHAAHEDCAALDLARGEALGILQRRLGRGLHVAGEVARRHRGRRGDAGGHLRRLCDVLGLLLVLGLVVVLLLLLLLLLLQVLLVWLHQQGPHVLVRLRVDGGV
mmetsp:Transcript_13781/g.44062  ORF Transcript_13781/g.44062 Transcript_13781/m.44062 type:complete len:275 (-) Transcript_13781:847-1671(-)